MVYTSIHTTRAGLCGPHLDPHHQGRVVWSTPRSTPPGQGCVVHTSIHTTRAVLCGRKPRSTPPGQGCVVYTLIHTTRARLCGLHLDPHHQGRVIWSTPRSTPPGQGCVVVHLDPHHQGKVVWSTPRSTPSQRLTRRFLHRSRNLVRLVSDHDSVVMFFSLPLPFWRIFKLITLIRDKAPSIRQH